MSLSTISAAVRADTGKQAARQLRRNGRIPGIYYSHGESNVLFSIDTKELRTTLSKASSILDVEFSNGSVAKCIVREIQWDPIRSVPLHIDLMGVKLTEAVTVEVPIRITGVSDGVKNDGGVLQQLLRDLSIECLPLDIPESIDVDVTALKIHDAIHVSDLRLDKVEILDDPEQVIVSVLPPRVEEETLAAEAESAEPEVISHGKKDQEDSAEAEEKGKK